VTDGGYAILDHPADLGIDAWGDTMVAAFRNAALALVSIILDPAGIEAVVREDVRVRASDRDQLLVKWLEEILYLYDGRGYVPREIEIMSLSDTALAASLMGEPISPSKHDTRMDVKAITYHQLKITEDERGARVRVYLDI
jgi:SHS2 domain-containing protein